MASNATLNSDNCTKLFRAIQLLVCLITLGLVGENISAYHSIQCNSPPRLSYNAACAGLSLPILLYLLLSTGSHKLKFLPWNQWFQLFIDGFFFLLWLAAASVSNISCDMMCTACNGPMWEFVQIGDTSCTCTYTVELDKRATSSSSNGGARLGKSIGTMIAKQGVDATMVILFFVTLLSTIHGIYTHRKALKGHGPASAVPSSRTTDANTAYEPMQYQGFGEQQKYKANAHVEETAVDPNENAYPAGYGNPAAPYGYPPQQPISAYTGGNVGGDDYAPLMGQGQPGPPYTTQYRQVHPYAGT